MDEKVYEYRKRHPCCNYCKYLKLEVPPVYCVSSYYNCKAKDRIIHCIYPLPARRLPPLQVGEDVTCEGYVAVMKLIKEVKRMTNYERIKQMSIDEMSLLLMKVNCAYDIPCMLGMSSCKYPHMDNNCSICFKEWLESDVDKE